MLPIVRTVAGEHMNSSLCFDATTIRVSLCPSKRGDAVHLEAPVECRRTSTSMRPDHSSNIGSRHRVSEL